MPDVPELALLWAMKRFYPAAEERDVVGRMVAEWVESLPTAGLRPAIRDALQVEQGTPLEPFMLDPEDIDEAADLGAIALHAGFALRVVSRDKLEPVGGLELGRGRAPGSLKARYVQRLASSTGETEEQQELRFAPGFSPAAARITQEGSKLTALLAIGEEGHVIRIGPLGAFGPTRGDRDVEVRVLGETSPSQSDWSGRVTMDAESVWLDIHPRGPEQAIQATALMLKRCWLIISTPLATPWQRNTAAVKLELPAGADATPLLILPEIPASAYQETRLWLHEPLIATPLADDVELKRKIVRWLGLPTPWMTPEVLEGYA